MEENKKSKIASYKFEDSIVGVNALIFGNSILLILFLAGNVNNLMSNGHAQICLFTAILFYGISRFYDWQSQTINIVVIFIYGLILAIEFYKLGMLPPILKITSEGFASREVLMQLLAICLPIIYLVFRISLIIPLIQVYFRRNNLEKSLYEKRMQ